MPPISVTAFTKKSSFRGTNRSRHVVLFLAANPIVASRLSFDQECAAIESELRLTEARDEFDFRSKWAVTADEMMRHLNELRPAIFHFSGHGCKGRDEQSSVASRDIASGDSSGYGGLYLQDEHGAPQLVTPRALRLMVKAAADSARVVVLNACYSSPQASALRSVVDCVIGMTGAIQDDVARSFAISFYRAIGNRRSIGNAVEQAIAVLAAKRLSGPRLLCCRTRRGIDANQVVLGNADLTIGVRPGSRRTRSAKR